MSSSLSQAFDVTRAEIVARMQQRIELGERTKLRKAELDELISILVSTLIEMNNRGSDTKEAIDQLCAAEQAMLETAYPANSINSVYFPRYTKAIKSAIEAGRIKLTGKNSYSRPWAKRNPKPGESSRGTEQRHYALDGLSYPVELQSSLRAVTTANANTRQDNRISVDLEAYLEQIQVLLASNDSLDLIIAIAAVTGRRHTEVVSLGQLSPEVETLPQLIPQAHPFMLRFKGHQKSDKGTYDILALVPAEDVLLAVEKLRDCPEVAELAGISSDDPRMEALNARVNRRVVACLGDVLQPPLGFSQISIHRCRAVYIIIALHYFCPANMAEQRMAQHLLGHVLLDDEAMGNASVTGHYYQYFLTRDGKPLTARGVKLAASGPVPLPPDEIDEPVLASPASPPNPMKKTTPTKTTSPVEPNSSEPEPHDQQPYTAATLSSLAATISTQAQTIQGQAQTIDRLSKASPLADPSDEARMSRLEAENTALQDMIATLKEIADDPNQLSAAQRFFSFDFALPFTSEDPENESPIATSPSPANGREAAPAKQNTSGPPAKKPSKKPSQAYLRGQRMIDLAQQWAEAHPEKSVKMSTSLLKGVGIGTASTKEIYADFGDVIEVFNASLGEDSIISHNRGRAEEFLEFATQKLVDEGIYSPRS